MSNARKKVIVRRFTGDLVAGYLPLQDFVQIVDSNQTVYLLDLEGHSLSLPLQEIKTISFVRDFNLGDTSNPERLTRRSFLARPRNAGLWLRMTFRSGDQLEGLVAADLSLADALLRDGGFHLSPPDNRSNTQHIFVPRSAITDLQLLGVITTPSRPKAPAPPDLAGEDLQESLFNPSAPPDLKPD